MPSRTRSIPCRIEERFGAEVAHLVEGVTKIGRLNIKAPEARQAENVRKMLLAMVTDVRVVLVKLADRLHNMRTLQYLDPEKQKRISRETLDIYAPIAHRLGMSVVRGELEDLSFRYLEPEAFFALQKEISDKAEFHKEFLDEVQATIRSKLVEAGIPAELEARVKPQDAAAGIGLRAGLRFAGRARRHRPGAQLLRGAWRGPSHLATGARTL